MADNKVNSGLLEFSEDQKVFVALDAETSEVKKAVTIDGDGVETDIAGGGGGVTVEALSVTENGTYSEEGKAYSPVTVNVEGEAFKKVEVTSLDAPTYKVTLNAKLNDITGISYFVLTDAQMETLGLSDILDNTILLGPAVYDEDAYYGGYALFATSNGAAIKGEYSVTTTDDYIEIRLPNPN